MEEVWVATHEQWIELHKDVPRCCYVRSETETCARPATVAIHAEGTHPSEVTEGCDLHVGLLLADVTGRERNEWRVWEIDPDDWPYKEAREDLLRQMGEEVTR